MPIFICVDFNVVHEESSTLQAWSRFNLFTDLSVHFSNLFERPDLPTTVHGRRIDHVWANWHGLKLVKNFEIGHDHFATHHTCKFELNISTFSQAGWLRHKPARLDLRVDSQVDLNSVLSSVRNVRLVEWNNAKHVATLPASSLDERRQALNALVDIWSERAGRFVTARSGGLWRPALHQRGKIQPLKKSFVTAPVTRNNQDAHETGDRLLKVQQAFGCQRRLRAVERMHFGAQRWKSWINLERDLRRLFLHVGVNFTSEPSMSIPDESLFASLHQDLNFLINHVQGIAARKAKQCARDAMYTSAKYKYIRNNALPPQHFVNVANSDEPPDFTCDVSRIDRKIRSFWEDIWHEPPRSNPALERLFLDALPPGQPVVVEPITASDVDLAIKRAKGVAGADGWSADELRAVAPLYDQLAEVFNTMESAGVMPATSLIGDISLIPKASGSISFQAMRPITVMGLLHRVYAAVRLRKTLFSWQEAQFGDSPCMGCRLKCSTKDLVWPLCLQLEKNLLEGHEMFGVSSQRLSISFL